MNLRSLRLGNAVARGLAAIVITAAAAGLQAQPPGGSSGSRGFDPGEMIQRMDENRNGQIDPDEMNGRARGFLESIARDNNLDLGKPISNDKLKEIMKARFQGGGSPGSSGSSGSSSSSTNRTPAPAPAVKTFGVSTSGAVPKVLGFGADATSDSWDSLRSKYDARVIEKVEESLKRYDRNNDGVLDAEELKSGRWDSGSPLDHDKNKDGKASRSELAERYKQRYSSGYYDRGGPPGGGGPSGGYGGPGGPPGGYGSFGGYGGGPPMGYGGPPPASSSTSSTSSTSQSSYRPPTTTVAVVTTSATPPPSRSSSPPPSSNSSSSTSSGSGGDDRMNKFAEGMIRQYDTNKDGVLQRDEWSKLKPETQKADRDNNGLITKDEIAAQLADYAKGRSSGSSTPSSSSTTTSSFSSRPSGNTSSSYKTARPAGSTGAVKTYRFLSPVERLPGGLPDWFTRNDADGDGQIAMAEFSTAWDDAKASEFARWDRNGDGLITPKEAVGSGQ